MIFSEWIRRAGFWGLDFLRGSKVRKHFMDIKNILENDSDPDVSTKKEDYLNNILNYAAQNVEFYKNFKGFHSLDSFPVINKNIIRNNYAAFQSPEFQGAKVISMHTSGSTGTPFVVRQDRNKRDRVYAEMMYLWGKAGYQIGMKYAFLRIWTPLNRRSTLSAWARNVVMVDVKKENDKFFENIKGILTGDPKIRMLISYPGTLNNLANYLLAHGATPDLFKIKTIIGIGDAFSEGLHEKLKEVFNCNIVSLYSNQENGMLAVECIQNKEFHLNSASYHFEILRLDSDEPVEIGDIGRIVVTDLFNHAMPMIRYDTGDIGGSKKNAECSWHSQLLSSVKGRSRDFIFDTSGNRISPATISVLMWPFDRVLQFQFIQEDAKQYILKLNVIEGHCDEAKIVNMFKGLLGKDASISIEHVNEIPVLSSGKRKTVINNYKKIEV